MLEVSRAVHGDHDVVVLDATYAEAVLLLRDVDSAFPANPRLLDHYAYVAHCRECGGTKFSVRLSLGPGRQVLDLAVRSFRELYPESCAETKRVLLLTDVFGT